LSSDDADLLRSRLTRARTNEGACAVGVPRTDQRAYRNCDGEDDKTAITAITLLGKLAGEFKPARVLSFDELVKRAQTVNAGPLAGITQIREAEVIDADDDDDDGDTTE
jgi:hypothetical protein